MKLTHTITRAAALLALAAAPALAQDALVIRGGTVHPVSGPEFVGDVVIQDGAITAAGPNAQAPAGARVIDATGKHVYPGLFDAVTQLGLTEVGAVDVTVDINELGDFTPHLLAATAVHPSTEHIPVARANGITHAMSAPRGTSGGGFPGQGSIIHLDGWTVEEMAIDTDAALVMEWPSIRTREFDFSTFSWKDKSYKEAKAQYDSAVHRLETWLQAAASYRGAREGATFPRDLRLEALGKALAGEIPVIASANSKRDIEGVIAFAEKHGLRLIIAGASEGHAVADMLAAKRIPVILGPTQSLPSDADAAYDESFRTPGALHAAGVTFAFATFSSSDSRTLPYEAAMGVPYGLPRDAALRAITLTPAEMFGIADRFGSIEPGKVANLIVTDGDPLEITTHVEHLIINGQEASTMNKHRALYEKYNARPTTR